jgi:ornithine cyclodeaminase/alanine dehydrogenase-like protein (mu-crystallin family)
VNSAREAVEQSDIVTTITTAREPVFDGSWLSPGAHVNAAGGNVAHSRELDDATVRRANVVATDDVEQAKVESGDLIAAVNDGVLSWDNIVPLGSLVAGTSTGRSSPADITIFESQGIALEDVAVAVHVYRRAVEEGRGQRLAFGGTE